MTVLTPPSGSYSLDYVEITNDASKSVPVNIQSVSSNTLPTSGFAYGPSAVNFTRPNNTTAYAAGDVVGTDPASVLEFTNIGPSGGRILLQDATFLCGANSVPPTLGALRLHLYGTSPTAIADNAAYDLPSGDRAKYLGWFDFPTPQDLGDTIWSQTDYIGKLVKLTTASLFGILETRNACTPAAELAFTLRLSALEASR